MKKRNLFSFLILSSLSLTGCFLNNNNKPQEEDPTKEDEIKKTQLNYNYHDLKSNYVNLNRALPSIGSPKLLIIPVFFNDSDTFIKNKDNVRNDINDVFFANSFSEGNESVKSYYAKLSSNLCVLDGKVTDWYEVNESYVKYATGDYEQELLEEATNYYFENNKNDSRKNYDLDKDGYLDSVILVYGAPTYEAINNPSYSNLWSFVNWKNATSNLENPNPSTYMWVSYSLMYGNNVANERAGTSFSFGDTTHSRLDTHTFIHESGHLFGLKDYYDYSGTANPAGGFSMQDRNVGSHDPFSVMALGWVNPYIPTDTCDIEINTFQSSRDLVLLSNSFNEDKSPFDEYFLIELYSSDGLNKFDTDYKYKANDIAYKNVYPQGLDDFGIRIWHVDARLLYSANREINANHITTNPKIEGYKVTEMMSNSYGGTYASYLGSAYYNYNILQLIRNTNVETYKPSTNLDSRALFKNGSYFSLNAYKNQFVKNSTLNNGEEFLWSFDVEIKESKATLKLFKESI